MAITSALQRVESWLSYKWADWDLVVTADDMQHVDKELLTLPHHEVQAVISNLNDKYLNRWAFNKWGGAGKK